MGEERVAMKLVLCLCLALFAASAIADVTELPESANTESVEPADMEFLQASFEDAKQTVTGLMQAGKNDAACKDLADASKREVTDSVAASQKAVKAMPNGSQCDGEGKELVTAAEANVAKAKTAVSDAQNKVNAAKAVKINFGDMVVSSLDGKKCSNFYNSLVYTNAKKKIKDAETHYQKKVAEKDAAVKEVATAKKEAARLVMHCKCRSKRAIDKAVSDLNSKAAAMNKASWTKSYHMECVLAGKTQSQCSVPTVPTVKTPAFSAGTATACSATSNWVGCFVDNGSRDFKHGPKQYGYSPGTCMSKCKQYKYIALQNGGWCNCDNTFSTPATTCPKKPDGECNKGGKGQGGPWRNAVYSNTDWVKTLKVTTAYSSCQDARGKRLQYLDRQHLNAYPAGTSLSGFHLTGGGCNGNNMRYWQSSIATPTAEKTNQKKYTGCTVFNGKQVEYLDRQAPNCGATGTITGFGVVGCGGSNKKYEYMCSYFNSKVVGKRTAHYTGCADARHKDLQYLDRQKLVCPFNTAMSSFHLTGSGCGGNNMRYKFTCLDMHPI